MRQVFEMLAWLKSIGLSTDSITEVWGLILNVWNADSLEDRISASVKLAQFIAARVPGQLDDRLLAALAGLTDGEDFQKFVKEVREAMTTPPNIMGEGLFVSSSWTEPSPATELADLMMF